MRKLLLLLAVISLTGISVNAQTVLFSDDFESYTTGGFLSQQATPAWKTWSNQPGGAEDATISEAQAHSPIKSVYIGSAQDDIILPLGNKTSGRYNVSFWYYIPVAFGGYFNVQHYESPGIQWAIEVYFGNNGNGNIEAEGIITNFTHLNDAWIQLETVVDIDLDSAWFYVDGSEIVSWKFSTKSDGTAGANQLGGINFYGGAITGQTPRYYFDDVTFTELASGATPPEINVSLTEVYTSGLNPEAFTITNIGDQDMSYEVYTTYPYSATNVTVAPVVTELTHIASAFTSGLGGFTQDLTVKAAAKFKPSNVSPAIGQELVSVLIGINDVPTNTSLLIYDRGSFITPGPGTLLATKPFTATTPGEMVQVTLDNPIYLDGRDIWIGYTMDALATTYPMGLDAGPRVLDANWISVGPGWSEYNPTVDANLIILGNLQGNPVEQWLSVTPQSGTLASSLVQQIDLSFDITGLPDGNYTSIVMIGSNDPNQEFSEVAVYLTVITNVPENGQNIGIITYPNPATQNIHIKSNTSVDFVTLYDMNGRLIKTVDVNSFTTVIPVNGLSKGNYLMEIKSGSNIVKRNIVVN